MIRDEVRRALAEAIQPDEYLATREAAGIAGVAVGTIRRWVREGRLPEHRAGRVVRVRRSDLEKLLRSGRRRTGDLADGLSPEARALRDFGAVRLTG